MQLWTSKVVFNKEVPPSLSQSCSTVIVPRIKLKYLSASRTQTASMARFPKIRNAPRWCCSVVGALVSGLIHIPLIHVSLSQLFMFLSLNPLLSLPSILKINGENILGWGLINYIHFCTMASFSFACLHPLSQPFYSWKSPGKPSPLCKGLNNKIYTSYSDSQTHWSLQPHHQTSLCS